MFTFPAMLMGGASAVDLRSAVLDPIGTYEISCAHDSAISLSGDLTIEFWTFFSTVGGSYAFNFCSKGTGFGSGWTLEFAKSIGAAISWRTGSGGGSSTQRVGWAWSTPSAGTWYHIALTYDVSQSQVNEAKLYINAVDQGLPSITTTNNFSSIGTNSSPLVWGEQVFGGGTEVQHFCEMRLWDHVRTSTQISDNKDTTVDPSSSGLVAYIHPTTTIEDVSDSALTLTTTGVTTSTEVPF